MFEDFSWVDKFWESSAISVTWTNHNIAIMEVAYIRWWYIKVEIS